MSPYRVLVRSSSNKVKVLAAMLSIDPKTGKRNIYIIEKVIPPLFSYTDIELQEIAHKMTTAQNSYIQARYAIVREGGYKYKTLRRCGSIIPGNSRYLQSDCLLDAMHDYLEQNNLTLSKVI